MYTFLRIVNIYLVQGGGFRQVLRFIPHVLLASHD